MVKVTLRNQSIPTDSQTPSIIFDILKQHFGELVYSSMPMADFYNTRPLPNESVMEYWIRLNKAIDIADKCLHRQGRSVEDPGREVSMMFIKYCPDPVLTNRLSFKAAEEWTTSEVQEHISIFQRECRAKSRESTTSPRLIHNYVQSTAAPQHPCIQSEQVNTYTEYCPTSQYHVSLQIAPKSPAAVTQAPVMTSPYQQLQHSPVAHATQPTVSFVPQQPVPAPPQPQVAVGSVVNPPQSIDFNGVHSLMSLLDCLVTHYNPRPSSSVHPVAAERFPRPCKVCGDPAHSTLSHCRRNNLCLACFSPGHWKKNCPKWSQRPAQNMIQDNNANQNQPLGN